MLLYVVDPAPRDVKADPFGNDLVPTPHVNLKRQEYQNAVAKLTLESRRTQLPLKGGDSCVRVPTSHIVGLPTDKPWTTFYIFLGDQTTWNFRFFDLMYSTR